MVDRTTEETVIAVEALETIATLHARIAALEAQLAGAERRKQELEREVTGLRNSYFDERRARLSALEATPPAPKVTDVEFRLLEVGETLQSDDEVVDDNGKSWVPVDRWAVGTPYSRAFKSARRPLTAAQEVTDEVIKAQNYLNDAVYSGLSDQEIARRARMLITAAQEAGKP